MNTFFYGSRSASCIEKIMRLISLLQQAIDKFNNNEQFLIEHNYDEVSMVHHLARYISEIMGQEPEMYNDLYCDIEYNRGADGNEHLAKHLRNLYGEDKPARLDLVITERKYFQGEGFRNLLCAEVKKWNNKDDWDKDRYRLMQLTALDKPSEELFGYRIGFFIVIGKTKMEINEIYMEGKKVEINNHLNTPEGAEMIEEVLFGEGKCGK